MATLLQLLFMHVSPCRFAGMKSMWNANSNVIFHWFTGERKQFLWSKCVYKLDICYDYSFTRCSCMSGGGVTKIDNNNPTRFLTILLASGTYCSIHPVYVNVCKILYRPVAFCNVLISSSRTLGKWSFGSTQLKRKSIGVYRKEFLNP